MSEQVKLTCYVTAEIEVTNSNCKSEAIKEAMDRLKVRLENLSGSDITGPMEPMFCEIKSINVTDIEDC